MLSLSFTMPEKPLTVAAYAAGASAAAITLFYVLGPTFFLDDNNGVNYNRNKGVVGLRNPANDCFINSILQTLAGLPKLRYFLIRELHRRSLDGVEPYDLLPEDDVKDAQDGKREVPVWETLSLQHGVVSIALKDILNALNERPICKKTISAQSFVRAVEEAFRTRINRSQQDAQEFLQLVIERVLDEWYAARKARRRWRKLRAEAQRKTDKEVTSETMGATEKLTANVDRDLQNVEVESKIDELERSQETIKSKRWSEPGDMEANSLVTAPSPMGQRRQESRPDESCAESDDKEEEDESFPFEGKLESQIECQHCHFKPKPSVSTFVILPLSVPQTSSTSLNTCLDGLLKQEHIDDFKCDRCRLVHALESKKKELSRSDPTSESKASQLRNDISAIEKALFEDPEQLPKNAGLPDISLAPQRRITRHTRISNFPDILSIHLSRSIFVPNSSSTKNTAKVSFPESFPLGGLLDQHRYRLLGVVTHKGGHNSGHYESFRRQTSVVPFSTPANFGTEGIYSAQHGTCPCVVPNSAPPRQHSKEVTGASIESKSATPDLRALSETSLQSESSSSSSSRSSQSLNERKTSCHLAPSPASKPTLISSNVGVGNEQESSPASMPHRFASTDGPPSSDTNIGLASRFKRTSVSGSGGRKKDDRWWRISDDKIKESKTSDVLGMQREVYLLFYQRVKPS